MARAFVLVRLVPGLEREAFATIGVTAGVSQVNMVFGHWDAVIQAEAKDLNALTGVVVRELRGIRGVEATETLLVTEIG